MRSSTIKIIFKSVNILKITFNVILMVLTYSLRINRIYNSYENMNLHHKSEHFIRFNANCVLSEEQPLFTIKWK